MGQYGNNYQPAPQPKDPNTVFLIELVGGFFGFLGLGYFYVGRTNDGVLRLLLWLVYGVTAYVIITLLLAVFIGIICIPIQLVIQVGVPFWSANTLKNDMLSGNFQQ
jgi:TM2 domain-containing membrane protein YozV